MTGRLAGEIAIVTGAGSGIGRATALRFAEAGARVLAVDRVAEGLDGTRAAASGGIETLVQDVASDDAPELVERACRARLGAPSILINNAGIGGAKPVDVTEDADLDRFIAINLRSVFRMARMAVRAMLPARRGAIVNMASVFGMTGFVGSSAYSATKAAVVGLTQQMAAEYGRVGIRVNAIAPGVIRTGMTARNIETNAWYRAAMMDTTPMESPGEPDDIDVVVSYLPVGSQARPSSTPLQALEAGCAFVNCIPVFIASAAEWRKRFEARGLPLIGDDIKSQVGATIVHRVLANLFRERGVRLDRTYQLNFGGNTDFLNMLERERLESKKISKTQAVTSQLDVPLDPRQRPCRAERPRAVAHRPQVGLHPHGGHRPSAACRSIIELKLEVWDSPNSAGVVIDAVRCAKLALDRGIGGALIGPSATS
jgi:NAD(P)-dependent dehydrogenase (short-subunit alcohol dehydrogenase family)